MQGVKGILRERWSYNWPGLLLGVFCFLAFLLLKLLLEAGDTVLTIPSSVSLMWVLPAFSGFALMSLVCFLPLLFAKTRRTFLGPLAGRLTSIMVNFVAVATGYYAVFGALFLLRGELICLLFLAGLLVINNAADMTAQSLNAGKQLGILGRISLILVCLVNLGVILLFIIF